MSKVSNPKPAPEPGKAQREIEAYRKRLDAWSKEQEKALDALESGQ